MKYEYKLNGIAFGGGGDVIDETQESNLEMRDFVLKDLSELAGLYHSCKTVIFDNYTDYKINFDINVSEVSPTKAIIEGVERLYIIEQTINPEPVAEPAIEQEYSVQVQRVYSEVVKVKATSIEEAIDLATKSLPSIEGQTFQYTIDDVDDIDVWLNNADEAPMVDP